MRKLILYTLIFLSPFIVSIVAMECLLRRIPNSHQYKADDFEPKIKSTKIIILGNSHVANGLNPEYLSKEAYNLAQGAQTIDIDNALLQKYQDKLESLEYVIVGVSYHSLWLKLSDADSYKWMQKYNNIYFDINIEKNPIKRFLFLDETIKNNIEHIKQFYVDKKPVKFDFTNGFMPAQPATDLDKTVKHGASVAKGFTFTNLDYRYAENVKHFEDIISIAKTKNCKVILVTLPCYPTYLDNLDPKQLNLMYKTIENWVDNKSVFYYDFLEDAKTYKLEDFSNGDHLSYIGAKKITLKLDSIIRDIENKEINTP